MPTDNPLVLYAALFIGILLLVEGLYRFAVDMRHGPQAKVNRRLRMLEAGHDHRDVLQALRRERAESYSAAGRLLMLPQLERLIVQSGSTMAVSRLLLVMAGLGVAAFATLSLVRIVDGLAGLAIAAAVGILVPLWALARARKKRMRQFGMQLPDAIELIARSLRAGHPLSAALSVVAQELPDPIGSEFGIAVDEMTYGLDLEEAVANVALRVGHPDLHYVVVAINIQYGTGGNLAEILTGLAKVIRDREQMFRKAKAVSAEGRLSAIFLAFFPMLLAAALYLINPDYYGNVSDEPLFPYFVGATIFLLISNVLVMRWLVNIRV